MQSHHTRRGREGGNARLAETPKASEHLLLHGAGLLLGQPIGDLHEQLRPSTVIISGKLVEEGRGIDQVIDTRTFVQQYSRRFDDVSVSSVAHPLFETLIGGDLRDDGQQVMGSRQLPKLASLA